MILWGVAEVYEGLNQPIMQNNYLKTFNSKKEFMHYMAYVYPDEHERNRIYAEAQHEAIQEKEQVDEEIEAEHAVDPTDEELKEIENENGRQEQ